MKRIVKGPNIVPPKSDKQRSTTAKKLLPVGIRKRKGKRKV